MARKEAPKPPKLSASKAEHKKFAKQVDEYEPYGEEPEGGVTFDESGTGEPGSPEEDD